MMCDICEKEFEPKPEQVRNLCDDCCMEMAYLMVTGRTRDEVQANRKLVN
jgi:hypothetical protein